MNKGNDGIGNMEKKKYWIFLIMIYLIGIIFMKVGHIDSYYIGVLWISIGCGVLTDMYFNSDKN